MVLRPLLHLGVVAIEKGAFGLPSATVANFIFFMIILAIHELYKGRLKSSLANQATYLDYDQIMFIFQHSPPCRPHTSSIYIAVLGCCRFKKSLTAGIPSYELFSPPSYNLQNLCIYVPCYIYIHIYIYSWGSVYIYIYIYIYIYE